FTSYRLHEGARDWWENLKTSLIPRGEDHILWDRFVELFRENFCSDAQMAALERELLFLEQGVRSVTEYERRFSELCRLFPRVHQGEGQR
ncbi:hypothetical protein, partial [Mycobacterium tuberculosis]